MSGSFGEGKVHTISRILPSPNDPLTLETIALCEHSIQFDHLIDWNCSKVLLTGAHYSKRLTSEAWFINFHPHVMNRPYGDSLPRVYRRLITSQVIIIVIFTVHILTSSFIVFGVNSNFIVA